MAVANIWSRVEWVDADGRAQGIGRMSSEQPRTITYGTGNIHDQTFVIANAGTQELFDVDDDIGNFDLMVIESTQSLLLQIVIDDDANNGESYQVKTIGANVPYILSSEVGLASNGSVDSVNGTSDLIERINCKNSSGSSATVRVVAFT